MNIFENKQNQAQVTGLQTLKDGRFEQLPSQLSSRATNGWEEQDSWAIDQMATWVLPTINTQSATGTVAKSDKTITSGTEGPVVLLRGLVKSSGIYALSAIAIPLISLVLAPFLTRYLSPSDYGILTLLNTLIGLGVGITQLGLASAFFRAYSYDYTSDRDHRDVLATAIVLLFLASAPAAVGIVAASPFLAGLLFGRPSLGNYVALAGGAVLLQNLTVPGFAWLRAENRPFFYSLLSICNLLITLIATIVLVGGLRLGVAGSLIAINGGYAFVVLCTIPLIVLRAGIKIRVDIARSMLAFGLPLVLNFVSYWVLQLSDRYLLSLFASFAETARYAVLYTLGSAISVVVIGPFTLAWPTAMFAIAKREDAAQIFKLIFRWFSLCLLFAVFGLSLAGKVLLVWLFPVTYHSSAFIIPIIAQSIAFYGIYFVFMAGANVTRKTWLAAVFTTIAAVVNLALNLVLIPLYGATGAAVSTLIAYIILALVAYIVNQRIYPIPFEVGRFIVTLFVGVALYVGSSFLAQGQTTYVAWGIYICALCLYSGCLALLGKFEMRKGDTKIGMHWRIL